MASDERMINIIVEYMEGVPIPTASWPESQFREASYSRSAADEILKFVLAHQEWSVVRSVEEFRGMVTKFMEKPTYHDDATYVFNVAYRISLDISDILMAMN